MALDTNKRRRKPRFMAVGNRNGLVDRVVMTIEDQILGGRLAVGTRLPPEREFCETLLVSRPVVREAVRILTTRGLLETRRGVGTTVCSVGRDQIVKPLTLFLHTRGQAVNVLHLHQVRSIFEIESAGLAAEYRTDDEIKDLTAIYADMETAAMHSTKFALRDYEFHRRLSEATHNPLLSLLLDTVHEMMAEVRVLVSNEQGLFDRVMPTHRQILESVAAGDAAGAREAMREHLQIALKIQTELIERENSD